MIFILLGVTISILLIIRDNKLRQERDEEIDELKHRIQTLEDQKRIRDVPLYPNIKQ